VTAIAITVRSASSVSPISSIRDRLDLTVSFLREESQGHRLYTFPMSDPTAQHILKLAVGLEDLGININRDVSLL
jgi:hypothetical protein